MKNKYAKRSRISEGKVRELVRYFAADLTALQAATLSGLNRNTVNRLYRGLRDTVLVVCEAQRPLFGVVEVDESFFGARRVKGRRGRGAYGIDRRLRHLRASRPSLHRDRPGLLEANPPGHHPRPGRPPQPSCNSDGWGGYDGLVDLGYGHFRVDHSSDEFTKGAVHINGIEGFWGLAKVRLAKFKGRAQTHLPPAPQGNRMALQQSTRRQVPNLAKISPPKPPQLGKTHIQMCDWSSSIKWKPLIQLRWLLRTDNQFSPHRVGAGQVLIGHPLIQ